MGRWFQGPVNVESRPNNVDAYCHTQHKGDDINYALMSLLFSSCATQTAANLYVYATPEFYPQKYCLFLVAMIGPTDRGDRRGGDRPDDRTNVYTIQLSVQRSAPTPQPPPYAPIGSTSGPYNTCASPIDSSNAYSN